MTEDEFWALIALHQTSTGPIAGNNLGAALQMLDEPALSAFEEHLVTAVSALLTDEHRAQTVIDADDPTDQPGMDADEIIEDVALAVVLTGRDRWNEVVHNPRQLTASWPLESSSTLLQVLAQSYEKRTGNPWVWAYAIHEAEIVPEPDAPRRTPWLHLSADFEDLRLRPEIDWKWVSSRKRPYEERISWLRDQLASFDKIGPGFSDLRPTTWSEWWDRERGHAALLSCYIKFDRKAAKSRHTIRVGKSWNQAEQISARSVYPLSELERTPKQMAELATAHASRILSRIVDRMELSQPPPLPQPS